MPDRKELDLIADNKLQVFAGCFLGGTSSRWISCSPFSKDFFAIIFIRHFHKFAIIRNSRERELMRNNGYHEQGVGTVCAVHIVLWFCHKQLFSLRNISFTFLFHLNSTVRPSVRPWVTCFSKTKNSKKFKEIQQNLRYFETIGQSLFF